MHYQPPLQPSTVSRTPSFVDTIMCPLRSSCLSTKTLSTRPQPDAYATSGHACRTSLTKSRARSPVTCAPRLLAATRRRGPRGCLCCPCVPSQVDIRLSEMVLLRQGFMYLFSASEQLNPKLWAVANRSAFEEWAKQGGIVGGKCEEY